MDYAQKKPAAAATTPATVDHTGVAVPLAGASAHLVQMAEDLNASPAVARLETLQRAASADSGLPAHVKAGVEALSGLSLEGVRVHRNSPRPAQFQAHAMTEGTDIHVAPGQERHVPHEAWHVVQQMQGRVRPTAQLRPASGTAAIPVNSDPALEEEADRMGSHALSLSRAGGLAAGVSTATARTAGASAQMMPAIVQRMAVQVVLDDKQQLVSALHIVGRPPKAHGNSMGDHLTAFTIQQRGLRRSVENRNFWQALAGLTNWMQFLKNLPGYNLIDSMPEKKREQTRAAFDEMDELREKLPFEGKAGWQPDTGATPYQWSVFQKLVTAALEALERLPLSTINVAAKNAAAAGKGKGEAKTANDLEGFENYAALLTGEMPQNEKDVVIGTIKGGFDSHAAMMALFEPDQDLLDKVAPGLKKSDTIERNIDRILTHHVMSTRMAFPHVMDAIGDKYLYDSMGHDIVEQSKTYSADLINGIQSKKRNSVLRGEDIVKRAMSTGKKLEDMKESNNDRASYDGEKEFFLEQDKLLTSLQEMRRGLGLDDVPVPALSFPPFSGLEMMSKMVTEKRIRKAPKQYEEKPHQASKKPKLNKKSSKVKTAKKVESEDSDDGSLMDSMLHVSSIGSILPGPNIELNLHSGMHGITIMAGDGDQESKKNADSEGHDDGEHEDVSEEKETKTNGVVIKETIKGISVQIDLDEHGVISNVIFAGRPPSPLRTGMGAHTTAWFVLQDWVRHALKNKSLPQAWEATEELVAKAKMHLESLSKHFVFSEDIDHQSGAGGMVVEENKFKSNSKVNLESAKENMENILDLARSSTNHSVMRLQSMIVHLLVFMNNIPGATLPAVNTNNRGEQDARSILLNIADGTARKAARKAAFDINGLSKLDVVNEETGMETYGMDEGINPLLRTELLIKTSREQAKNKLWDIHKTMVREAYPIPLF
ncbi:hypothetical protein M2352_000536 [Azospirillum fermentarium]|uniref:eCIS core domain-containing protein n=1 Tax=Azospirillum fermentarium TaxID=1233114 RepID=UPI0022270866|nr:DUF4157 domain-containing protein [Azospirillum fermentarium]MCW2244945.1 hypothetical protein [Azospirillum fermentarium]